MVGPLDPRFVPLPQTVELTPEEMLEAATDYRRRMDTRRSVREFSPRPVDRQVIEECLRAAGSAPSGANLQPWHFVVVNDPTVKHEIRLAAEEEERAFYEHRAPEEWLEALAQLGTHALKPYLEEAPYLIVVFLERYRPGPEGRQQKNYYPHESVGIATGLLVSALHLSGLATLTHTPSPMGFLNRILERPSQERPWVILVVGHAADGAMVPDIGRKGLDEIATFR